MSGKDRDRTDNFKLPLEPPTGIADARTYNESMEILDDTMKAIQDAVTSSDRNAFVFSRDGLADNASLRIGDGIPSNIIGYPVYAVSKLLVIAAVTQIPTTCQFRIYDRATHVVLGTLPLAAQAYGKVVMTVNLAPGNEISCDIIGTAMRPVVIAVVG